jgi:prephenate dehydrogenase
MAFTPHTITIYSVGLLGASLGLALKTAGYRGKIIGLSAPGSLQTALALGCIDEGYPYEQLQEVLQRTSLCVLCSPIAVIMQTLQQMSTMPLPPGLIVTDVGSTKEQIMQAAATLLPSQVTFIGGHPMAGSEKSGAAAADPYLFQSALYVLSALPQHQQTAREMGGFLEHYLGCKHCLLEPSVHDAIAATVSHLPHLLAVALVNLAGTVENSIPGTLNLAAGGFRDMTRIAAAPYSIWKDILHTNKEQIQPLISTLRAMLSTMESQLMEDRLDSAFDDAAALRGSLPNRGKGFIAPLSEVLVLAEDKPGIIAGLAQALADSHINIKDIEVLKVRENEGGTIRLAFDSAATALNAVKILNSCGFKARER